MFDVFILNQSIDKDFIYQWHLVSLTLSRIAVAFLLCVCLRPMIKLWEGVRCLGSYLESVTQHMTFKIRCSSFVHSKHVTAKKMLLSHILCKKRRPFHRLSETVFRCAKIASLHAFVYTSDIFFREQSNNVLSKKCISSHMLCALSALNHKANFSSHCKLICRELHRQTYHTHSHPHTHSARPRAKSTDTCTQVMGWHVMWILCSTQFNSQVQ